MQQVINNDITEITFDTVQELYDWLDNTTGGKMFSATFTKVDGEERTGTWIKSSAIKKDRVEGGELAYSPRDKGLYCVYEMIQGRQGDRWRMINLTGLKRLKIAGVEYEVKVIA